MADRDTTQALIDWSALFLQATMQQFNRFARANGISILQLTVLQGLHQHGPHEVTAFAEIMQVSPAGASQMVERLVQQGLVTRQQVSSDRRVREVHLTDAGRALVEAANNARLIWLEEIVDALPDSRRAAVREALVLLAEATPRSLPALTPGDAPSA